MAFTKYASLEEAQVLDVKGTKDRAKTASLDKISDFHDYRTEDGYLYARIRAISSRVNKNHDGWPAVELAGGQDAFDKHVAGRREASITVEADSNASYGYSTFLGKPVFVDHHNSDPERARGVIVDSKLHVEDFKTASELDPYYASAPDNHTPPTWVELLLEVDAKSFPRLAKAIIDGKNDDKAGIDGFSMGCDVEKSVCNICKNAAHSPDEYCNHVKMKGAEFDWINPKTGSKESKKSYEDCYGIKFFEISAVFDPADETALIRDVVHEGKVAAVPCPDCNGSGVAGYGDTCPSCNGTGDLANVPVPEYEPVGARVPGPAEQDYEAQKFRRQLDQFGARTASQKVAENPVPQSELTHAPEELDTLREETVCPVCGSTMDDTTCAICGYVEPPENFQNPDLERAKEVTPELEDPEEFEPNPAPSQGVTAPTGLAQPGAGGNNLGPTAGVKNDMSWKVTVHPKVAGRLNTVERPIKTTDAPQTDEPKEQTVNDETQPVTSSVRTAQDFIAAAERGKENQMSNKQKVAAEPVPAAKPDKRVNVDGAGGVADASNEQASRADAQVNVEGKGGTGVQDVSADQEGVNVDQGDEHSKNIDGTKTDTWSGEKGQTSPVKGESFPTENGQGKGKWSTNVEAAKKGTDPVDPVGKADDRVDVEQQVNVDWGTQPTNWTGTDGNQVTRQQSPVTNETLEKEDLVNLSPGKVRNSSHIFSAIKLADLEVELGLITADQKYERMAELEQKSEEVVQAELQYAARVRTAGLSKQQRTAHTAKRLPAMGRNASTVSNDSDDFGDELLYM